MAFRQSTIEITLPMISKEEYDFLTEQHNEGCLKNDYDKIIMIGSPEYLKMREYEQEFVCKHGNVYELQGGQIEKCALCGKTWR